MVRFNPLLCLLAAPSAVVAFQAPSNKARVYRPNEAVAIGTESFTQTPEKSSNDAGSMIDLTGVAFSVRATIPKTAIGVFASHTFASNTCNQK
jgi:hypothetical protein